VAVVELFPSLSIVTIAVVIGVPFNLMTPVEYVPGLKPVLARKSNLWSA
jgi:hypothetical protein